MEEPRKGQYPDQDRPADAKTVSATSRDQSPASNGGELEQRLIREAAEHAAPINDKMHKAGFGHHIGTEAE